MLRSEMNNGRITSINVYLFAVQHHIHSQQVQQPFTMRFQDILLASLLGVASAFTIPEGTEDGVYEHYLDSSGNDVHIKVANATNYDDGSLNAYARSPLPTRVKRAEDIPHCGAGNELNHAVSIELPLRTRILTHLTHSGH